MKPLARYVCVWSGGRVRGRWGRCVVMLDVADVSTSNRLIEKLT